MKLSSFAGRLELIMRDMASLQEFRGRTTELVDKSNAAETINLDLCSSSKTASSEISEIAPLRPKG